MNRFKTGDKVRRIGGNYCGMSAGDCDTVASFQKGVGLNLTNYGCGHGQDNFELVVEPEFTAELTSLCAQLRVYAIGKSYAKRDAYELVLTVQYLDNNTVHLSSAQGSITAEIRKVAFAKLKADGVTYVNYEHDGLQYTVCLANA